MTAHLRTAWRSLAVVEVEGAPPADSRSTWSAYHHPVTHRLVIRGPAIPNTHPYFQDDPTLAAWADVWVKADEVYIPYITVRRESRGQGLARELIQYIYDTWPDKGVDWGKMMEDSIVHLNREFKKRYPDRGNWGKMGAKQTVTLYHGTNQAALDEIRRDGQFEKTSPEAVNHEVEKRYGLPYDSVWRHKYNQFSHGRVNDQNVFFSGDRSISVEYAKLGSEVIFDALFAAWHLMSDPFDEEGDYKPGKPDERKRWMAEETAKHYQSVVLTVEVPFERLLDDREKVNRYTKRVTYEDYMEFLPHMTTEILQAPIPASWIKRVEKV